MCLAKEAAVAGGGSRGDMDLAVVQALLIGNEMSRAESKDSSNAPSPSFTMLNTGAATSLRSWTAVQPNNGGGGRERVCMPEPLLSDASHT